MAIDDDFVAQYSKRLILQYSDKPKAIGEIAARLESISNTYSFIDSFSDEFDLDQAYGHRLDIIGKIVGISRIVRNAIPKAYFGWDDGIVPDPKTFSEGALFDLFYDAGYTSTQLDDNQMRTFIRAKISKNIASAYLANDERVTLQQSIMFLFDSKAYVVDNYDMSLTIYLDAEYDLDNLILLNSQDLIPKPQGVTYKGYVVVFDENTFGFAENPNAETFGMGKFAELLPI
ncbi:DUF2612 domain-containing protein [Sulfurovum sp.]|uniref:DUF2612 domain-containing protein n=1 Tax=Sulfurovum sp. TaxID=1969726 RepID=UPI00356155A6